MKEIESDDDYSENESDELGEEPEQETGKQTPKTDRQVRDSTKSSTIEKKIARDRRQKELQRRRVQLHLQLTFTCKRLKEVQDVARITERYHKRIFWQKLK